MPDWFKDRLDVLRDALTLPRVLAIGAIGAAFSIAVIIFSQIAGWLGGNLVLGAPPWAWGVMASLVLLSWYLLEYALRLRRREKATAFYVPEDYLDDRTDQAQNDFNIRLRLNTAKKLTNALVRLEGLQRKLADGTWSKPLNKSSHPALAWSYNKMSFRPRTVDFNEKLWILGVHETGELHCFFDEKAPDYIQEDVAKIIERIEPGEYRMTFFLDARELDQRVQQTVIFAWSGKIDDFQIYLEG